MLKKKNQSGSALLEALISVVIFAIGVIGIGLFQAKLLKSDVASGLRLGASNYAINLSSLVTADPENVYCYVSTASANCATPASLASYTVWHDDFMANIPNAIEPVVTYTSVTAGVNPGQYSVTLSWKQAKEATVHKYVYISQLGW